MQNYVKYAILLLYRKFERMAKLMETTFTSVFYEKSQEDAEKRLKQLRKTDKYPELRAYILEESGEWRVLRKIQINLPLVSQQRPR